MGFNSIAALPLCYALLLGVKTVPSIAFNILVFLIGTNQFERSNLEFLAQQLALRHHNVITMKPILIPEEPRLVQPRLHLVRERLLKDLLPKTIYQPLEQVGAKVPWSEQYEQEAYREPYWMAHNFSCWKMLNSDMLEVLRKDKLDMAIVYAGNPCQLGVVHTLGLPFIYYDVEGLSDESIIASGMPWHLGYSHFGDGAVFRRLSRAWELAIELVLQSVRIPPLSWVTGWQSKRYEMLDWAITRLFVEDYDIGKRFKSRGGFPHVNRVGMPAREELHALIKRPYPQEVQIKQSAEFYFINTDKLLESAEQVWPLNVAHVGGFHLDTIKPLFDPWNTSISNAKEGIILVSFGTQVDTSTMPLAMVRALLNVFKRLNTYRVFWRIGPTLNLAGMNSTQFEKDLPPHINITTFFPQQELLASHRTKLFITNGGMNSIIEALTQGVPLLGIPLYGSNRQNLQKVADRGLGLVLEKPEFSEKKLAARVNRLLRDKQFAQKAKEFAREFSSRPSTPFDEALHLIEHTARYKSSTVYRRAFTHALESNKSWLYTITERFLLLCNIDVAAIVLFPLFILCILVLRLLFLLHLRLIALFLSFPLSSMASKPVNSQKPTGCHRKATGRK